MKTQNVAASVIPPPVSKEAVFAYRPAIDGLRALAVLSVIIFHLNPRWLPGGFVGVDVFFVISGYLITSIIFKECADNSFSLLRFYQRRIARIFPAFFCAGSATLIAAHFIYAPHDLASAGDDFSATALSIANLNFMLQGGYFRVFSDAQPYLHYWSLSVEEQFYLFFPLLFLLLFKYIRRHQALVLAGLGLGSFITCVFLMRWQPGWAFYLLPTRAWELLAGCILAVLASPANCKMRKMQCLQWFSAAGLGTILLSFAFVHGGPHFPGWFALFPVAGAVAVLLPQNQKEAIGERWLAAAPLVLIGRMSYSLYLWHWPIFSLVDYQMLFASEPARLAVKVCLSVFAATLSFWFVENPARKFFNRRKSRSLAYSFMISAVALSALWGNSVSKTNFVNAKLRDVKKGGLVFDARNKTSTVMLMGDSDGSMYGKVTREICAKLGSKLTVISASAQSPLPSTGGTNAPLWLYSLAVVQKERPDNLILACLWDLRLKGDKERLASAIESLKPLVGRLIILNQPPTLPTNANRLSLRQGGRPPFFEDRAIRQNRLELNDYLRSFSGGKVVVVDVSSRFEKPDGEVLFLDPQGRQLFHDAWHLSDYGTAIVRSQLEGAITEPSAKSSQP